MYVYNFILCNMYIMDIKKVHVMFIYIAIFRGDYFKWLLQKVIMKKPNQLKEHCPSENFPPNV